MQKFEKVPVVITEEYDEIAKLIAMRIAKVIQEKNAAGKPAVLGLATGSTPIGVYRELIRRHREEGLDFTNVITFNLDEYYPMPPTKSQVPRYCGGSWRALNSGKNVPSGAK